MVYGNDPIYTLSLIADKVLGIHSCMTNDGATSVLSGFDDPDGLLLKLSMVAFVYATYEEINDVLFNFSDELTYLPLDITTLLQVDEGVRGHVLDVLKELARTTPVGSFDRDEIARNIANTLPLIGTDTIQSNQLNRLLDVLGCIDSADLSRLHGYLAQLPYGNVFAEGACVEEEQYVEESIPTVHEGKPILDEAALAQLRAILTQQLQTLESVEDLEAFERVRELLTYFLGDYLNVIPSCFDSREALISWLRKELSEEDMPESVSETAPTEESLKESSDMHTEAEDVETPQMVAGIVIPEAVVSIASPVVAATAPKAVVIEVHNGAEKTEGEEKTSGTKKGVIGKTVKIDQESIDHLMNVVGELLVAKNSLPYLADGVHTMTPEGTKRAIMEKYTFINRLTEQLQDLIMSMRMLPISYVFDRYPKLVRDISKNLGKKVSLIMDGGETKLDKNMIEMLADPMIHIMRNSLDHGIELPEIRAQKGKNPEGQITLNAYAQSDKIVVEIRDDGAGINVDRVIQKVLEKELLTLDQIDAMNDDEKAALVMLPGLSTAETITEYSGRGVGMDVVRKSIEAFGGNIRIKTVPNQGTTIYLTIPMSLAVTSLLHVTLSGVHYGFPMDSVSETVKIDRTAIEYLQNEPFIYLRGEVIPLLFAKGMLDEKALANKTLPVVVLNIKGNLLAVVVNDLLGQLEVVQKPLEGIMENHPIFSGTALLGNGQIIMAIDPMGLLQLSHSLQSDYQHAS